MRSASTCSRMAFSRLSTLEQRMLPQLVRPARSVWVRQFLYWVRSEAAGVLELLLSRRLGRSFTSSRYRRPLLRIYYTRCFYSYCFPYSRRARYRYYSSCFSMFSRLDSSTCGAKFYRTCYENCRILSAFTLLSFCSSMRYCESALCLGLLQDTLYSYVALPNLLSLSLSDSFSRSASKNLRSCSSISAMLTGRCRLRMLASFFLRSSNTPTYCWANCCYIFLQRVDPLLIFWQSYYLRLISLSRPSIRCFIFCMFSQICCLRLAFAYYYRFNRYCDSAFIFYYCRCFCNSFRYQHFRRYYRTLSWNYCVFLMNYLGSERGDLGGESIGLAFPEEYSQSLMDCIERFRQARRRSSYSFSLLACDSFFYFTLRSQAYSGDYFPRLVPTSISPLEILPTYLSLSVRMAGLVTGLATGAGSGVGYGCGEACIYWFMMCLYRYYDFRRG